MQSCKREGCDATSNHAKKINIKQSKSYLTYVWVNHAIVNKAVKWSFKAINHVKIAKQSSKLTKSPCLKMTRYPLIDQLNATFSSTSVQAWSSRSPVESPICGLAFILVENLVLQKKWTRHLFYFKGKIKQDRKP